MSSEKVVLVTGASRGIGLSIAKAYAERGYNVVGTGTSKASVDSFNEKVTPIFPNACGHILDLNDDASTYAILPAIQAQFGTMPDILINNAGITDDDLFIRMSDEKWQKVINTNLTSVMKITKLALKPMLRKKWGRIVNISSVVASSGILVRLIIAPQKLE